MMTLQNNASGEVTITDGNGYDMSLWTVVAAPMPADMAARAYVLTSGAYVAQYATISAFQYLRLFTQAELAAAMGSADPRMRVAVALTLASPDINLGNVDVQAGIDLMVALGILTAARATAIKAGAG